MDPQNPAPVTEKYPCTRKGMKPSQPLPCPHTHRDDSVSDVQDPIPVGCTPLCDPRDEDPLEQSQEGQSSPGFPSPEPGPPNPFPGRSQNSPLHRPFPCPDTSRLLLTPHKPSAPRAPDSKALPWPRAWNLCQEGSSRIRCHWQGLGAPASLLL